MLSGHIHEAIRGALAERNAGRGADAVILANGVLRIFSKNSTNISRSNNGGDYSFWLLVRPDGYIRRKSSCDFWQPDDEYWLPSEHAEEGAKAYLDSIEACAITGLFAT